MLAEKASALPSELTSKATEDLAGIAIKRFRSLGQAIYSRLRQSRAHSKAYEEFEAHWDAAASIREREQAIRELLTKDPQFANSLEKLLFRRDFVEAMAIYCERLPALDHGLHLSEVYVPLFISAAAQSDDSPKEKTDPAKLVQEGNHLIEGGPGTGKSTLLHHLALLESRRLLDDKDGVAFDQLRLPVLISAKELLASTDLASTLQRTLTTTLSTLLPGTLPDNFFRPDVEDGHRYWLIMIDGIDEIENTHQRRNLWDTLNLHAARSNAFKFVVASRPESVKSTVANIHFRRWRIDPVNSSDRKLLADKYITDPELRVRFLEHIRLTEFRQIADTPLFIAMAAVLFVRKGELFRRKTDLCEHYLSYMMKKALKDHTSSLEKLERILCLIATDINTSANLVTQDRALVRDVVEGRSALDLENGLDLLLRRTGIVRDINGKLRFSHDLFRSYFVAIDLADRYQRTPDTLSIIDPFKVGWTTIEYLFCRWVRLGYDVNPALKSLLEFGDEGLRSAAEIVAACPSASDALAEEIADRFLREAKDTGPTIIAQYVLTMLAGTREVVRQMLNDLLYDTDFISDTFIAECLLDAGHMEESLDCIQWIAAREDGYCPDRVTAAELLLKHNFREQALAALKDVTCNGDELWPRFEAACRLYELDRTVENRAILAEMLAANRDNTQDHVFARTLSRLMELGEVELALPHLLAAAQPPQDDENRSHSFDLDEAIEASRTIAVHCNRETGKELLERLLLSSSRMREKAEVISAMADIGFDSEAKQSLRTCVLENPCDVDWFTVNLLVRLGMEQEACSRIEATIRQLLEQNNSHYEVVSLIEHVMSVADTDMLADLLQSQLRLIKSPRLARALALLGRSDEARSHLLQYTDDADVSLQIKAAGELCRVGLQRIGLPRLATIVRDKSASSTARILAAEEIQRIGLFRHAAFAFARLVRDKNLEIEERASAAIAFDELLHDRNHLVCHPLLEFLQDQKNPVANRVKAAEALIRIDDDDGYADLVIENLEEMLDQENLSDQDALSIGEVLAKQGSTLSELPKFKAALISDNVSVGAKIRVLHSIVAYDLDDRNKEATLWLSKLARDPEISVEHVVAAIDAIWHSDYKAELQEILNELVRNKLLPPKWRLKAAKQCREDLLYLARDNGIDIETRVAAIEALPKSAKKEQITLLKEIATMPDLTFGDHLCLAGVAHRWKVPALVEALLQAAAADHPLSASEIVELATTYKEVGDETSAQQMLNELITLPLIILENCGDISLVLEGLELAAELQPLKVVDLLVGLLLSDSTEWWNVVEILATLVEVEGEVAALIHATPRIEELGRSIKNATDTDSVAWPYLVGEFMERGWFNDHAALLAFARNEACSISERAEACALLIRFAFTGSSVWCAAQDLLAQFRVHDTLSISDRIAITTELRRQNCKKEAQDWLDQCLRLPLRETKDHRDLARLLFDFGRNAEAKALVESISASEFAKDFMVQRDEELLELVVGEDVADAAILKRVFDNDDPYDQLWRAREYVEEHCDRRALSLVLNTAMGAEDDPHLQLEAIECLEQLGFRELSRCRFSEMKTETVEPYWLANQLMQFGRKLEAAPLFITAALSSPEYNENTVCSGLADLGLADELNHFQSMRAAKSSR